MSGGGSASEVGRLVLVVTVVLVLVMPYHCRAASNESGAGSGL
jgi:hypothetical protein